MESLPRVLSPSLKSSEQGMGLEEVCKVSMLAAMQT